MAGGGDGQASGLGTGTLGGGRAYLNLGTAAVSGVWGRQFATSHAFRTLTSLSGEGYIFELCLRTGAYLTDWSVKNLFGADPAADPAIYQRLEAEAAQVPPGADGILLLPYWSGTMAPFWDPDAGGAVVGLRTGHGRGHYWRAMLEGVALDCAMGYGAIEAATGEPVSELLTIGGGAKSALMRRIVADATGRPVQVSSTLEASCLGAAMLAASGAGWYATPAEASRRDAGRGRAHHRARSGHGGPLPRAAGDLPGPLSGAARHFRAARGLSAPDWTDEPIVPRPADHRGRRRWTLSCA